MARRRNIWGRLNESTEGPTVTLSLPREYAEQLLQNLMTSLEMDGGGDEIDGDLGDDDLDGLDPMMGDDGGEGDLDAGFPGPDDDAEELDFAAGDDSDDDGDSDDGRPKAKKSKDEPKKKDDKPKDKEKKKDETFETRPATALGESAFRRAGRLIEARRPPIRRR